MFENEAEEKRGTPKSPTFSFKNKEQQQNEQVRGDRRRFYSYYKELKKETPKNPNNNNERN